MTQNFTEQSKETQADEKDLLWGAEEIGRAIKRRPRQVYYMAARELLPVTKTGRLLTASRQRLLKHLTGQGE